MPTWNMFDPAVAQERDAVRAHALRRGVLRPVPTSYKAQALRELARRLVLEERLREAQAELARALDRVDDVNDLLQAAGLREERDA